MTTADVLSLPVEPLRIGGLVPMTTIDFPDHLSAVVFTRGCNLRCQYCYNTDLLQTSSRVGDMSWEDVLGFLDRRQGLLDSVVFSGGEPLLQKGLGAAMRDVNGMGFKVGLHTAGQVPERLQEILPHLDWVGLDIKGLPDDYPRITGTSTGDKGWQSLNILMEAGIPHEVRTTVHWGLTQPEKFNALADCLQKKGVQNFTVQRCRIKNCFNSELQESVLDPELEADLLKRASGKFERFAIR
ncbi:anaerobic ribonucleoside-triphosphate reductase activating protein [Sansalvadorimonas sp. 2012CJ34-2]|uniref:Anaerobic ribonucleoside-triphosphate reductase activating protein n=1 Tax=Parendozoicomonas callyspongiae TaxID=2942213 RepID=A0ABT0PJI8_9GAMM|nr:anaerobic ribonucleoside-triphosphate reductase activating protein [Sansalvadorimonas sp. 2012CJ34-2]MCL6271555.1 anaerobic ribonucleoside-triphosphate reductase activating protein [Sansalvadorimonas sp. 2012CJ34-2]